MQKENAVLVFTANEEGASISSEFVSAGKLPDSLNGESGFHIYHVRMLTELILNQLCAEQYALLPEEEIEWIAMASSLHDIGKSKIPQAILDFPGKLSPLEYDIIKKHSRFGAELIEQADFGELPQAIKRHAYQIALYHHERFDGTGYPEGLKGEDIPLSAQVVALADSYDALTSTRSYKDSFSQDVAIQMISSGMCGFFKEELINALIKVVNHSSLLALRDKLYKSRSVITEELGFVPERVLCIGNTEYLTAEFIEAAFPKSKVTVIGNTELGSAERIKLFKIKKPSIKAVFETYDFDLVVYFSGDLSFKTTEKNDSEELREVLESAKAYNKELKLLFLSSLDSSFQTKTDRGILSAAKENLCEFYAKEPLLDIKLLKIPYLYSGSFQKDFLYKAFAAAHKGKPLKIEEDPEARLHFISSSDLSSLLFRLIENWKSGSGALCIGDDFNISFRQLSEKLTLLCGAAPFEFIGSFDSGELPFQNKGIRNEYGWFAKISILEDLEEEQEKYLASLQDKDLSRLEKIKKWISEHSLFVKLAELIIFFILTELLLHITGSAVVFSIVDFRMAYIVIMATAHGLNFGLAAATLSSISWLVSKVASGTNLLTIFYEPTNWLAFVFFFLIASLCGYIKLRKDDTIRFVSEQNRLLEDKLIFTREIYEDTHRERRDLKKQIIGSKDSFGKIFDITRKLDTVEPQLLYLRIMETFEDILENKSITVYSVNGDTTFGRLEVASREIIDNVSRSISTDTYKEILDSIKGGNIWRNTELKLEFPMYAAGVFRGERLELLIFLWRTDISQRSLYYVNLFKILRDLVQMSLLRALDYNSAIYDKQYLKDSHVMNEETFKAVLENYTSLADEKVSAYILLEVEDEDKSLSELEALLSPKIRSNDILGIGENGRLRVLLSQATENDLQFILPRFKSTGLSLKVL